VRRRKEFFRICRSARRYDRRTGKFVINIAYETAAPKVSDRVLAVAEGFGLGLDEGEKFVLYENVSLKIGRRDVVYVTGDSGSGKSVLLRALEQDIKQGMHATCINIAGVKPEPGKPLIETVGCTVEEGMELLAKVGLGDAFLFLRSFDQLSDGQKYRYRIAKMIESRAEFWVADEFAATLDRDTAKIVAFNLQKLASQQGKTVLVATTHTDLLGDLSPSVHIHKRFGKEITVKYYPNKPAEECSLVKEMRITEGSTTDWRKLACFHYRSHKIVGPRKVFCLKRGDELCGVIAYCYPPPACFGRRLVLPKMSMSELNEKLSIISRVVVHPKYRSIGIGSKLVKETLPLAGTQYIEMSAVMAKYNPFAERAGMKKVAEQPPAKEALKVAETLLLLGFNTELLSSRNYLTGKLHTIREEDATEIRNALIKHAHSRFQKHFFPHTPFGRREEYGKKVAESSLSELTELIRICAFLLQTKVYLFWQRS
jgi:ABC-type lipoprotein export system ATPase subunit/GNAT superfamily N-acetyltransferase